MQKLSAMRAGEHLERSTNVTQNTRTHSFQEGTAQAEDMLSIAIENHVTASVKECALASESTIKIRVIW